MTLRCLQLVWLSFGLKWASIFCNTMDGPAWRFYKLSLPPTNMEATPWQLNRLPGNSIWMMWWKQLLLCSALALLDVPGRVNLLLSFLNHANAFSAILPSLASYLKNWEGHSIAWTSTSPSFLSNWHSLPIRSLPSYSRVFARPCSFICLQFLTKAGYALQHCPIISVVLQVCLVSVSCQEMWTNWTPSLNRRLRLT